MPEIPFISVVIPHLNQPEALPCCLASLAAQTYRRDNFEVIVVDNGSIMPPSDVVDRFDRVRLASEVRRGPGPARNRGVALSRGELLAFIDADCMAHPDWLAMIAQHIGESEPRTILGGDVRIAYRKADHLTTLEAYESVFAYRQKEYIEKHGFSGTGNLAVRRRDFEAIGPFPGIDQAEDRVWGRHAIAQGYRFSYVPEMIVFHPARQSFAEIFAKWDRHILHEHSEWFKQGKGRIRWLLRSFAVGASPIVSVGQVLSSPRISGLAAHVNATGALVTIRLYRARQMVKLLLKSRNAEQCPSWNQPSQQR